MLAPVTVIDWEAIAIAVVKYGGAVAILWKGSHEAGKTIRATLVLLIDKHVKPLFDELRASVDGLKGAVESLTLDHKHAAERLDEHDEDLDAHDARLTQHGERIAKVEGVVLAPTGGGND